MTIEKLALVSYPALLLVIVFFVRQWMDAVVVGQRETRAAIERYEEKQRTCQITLATTYRTKIEAEKSWAAHLVTEAVQDVKLGDLTSRVVKLEATCSTRHGE